MLSTTRLKIGQNTTFVERYIIGSDAISGADAPNGVTVPGGIIISSQKSNNGGGT
jgi:hypothetical protein